MSIYILTILQQKVNESKRKISFFAIYLPFFL